MRWTAATAGVALLLTIWALTSMVTLLVSDSYVLPALKRTAPALNRQQLRDALRIVAYLETGNARELEPLSAQERSHMGDVRGVVDSATLVSLVCTMALILGGFLVRSRGRSRDFLSLVKQGAIYGEAILGLLLITAALSFERLFTTFHKVFFPQGNWLFAPGSVLVTLFPERFWLLSAIVLFAGAAVWLGVVAVLAWRFGNNPTPSPPISSTTRP